ncbi:MAG: helix-turn-helix domain-containing protein, partial [Clostridium celatum]|nr:helix-turn-helix domain-containing protein [Clostridium celatum]
MWYTELKKIRVAIGMQAKELAEKVGKSATYISRIESGAIINTSFELVSSIARVIAESDEIKSGRVDLSEYNSDFSKLVLSYRYETMKDVYDYVNENKEVEQYSNIVRYLNKGDMDLFETVAR